MNIGGIIKQLVNSKAWFNANQLKEIGGQNNQLNKV